MAAFRRGDHPYDAILDIMRNSPHFLTENDLEREKESDPVFQKLLFLKTVNKLQREILDVKSQSQKLIAMNRAADILRPDELEAKLRTVELLLQSFELCVNEMPRLQDALCRPFHGKSLKIHRKYHESSKTFLYDCAALLEKFQRTVETLEWHQKNSHNNAATKTSLEKLSSAVEELKQNWIITEQALHLLQDNIEVVKDTVYTRL